MALAVLLAVPAGADVLDEAREALARDRPAAALALMEGLRAEDVSDPVALGFLRGVALLEAGEPDAAIAQLRPLVARHPRFVRIRLELARAYFAAGRDSAAERQFRQVLGGDLPDGVRRTILSFLDAIRRREAWSGSVRAGVAPDTNVSASTSDEAVFLFGRRFELSEEARRRSGVGLEVAGDVRRLFAAPGRELRPVLSAGLFVRDYANDDFDDLALSLGGGVDWDRTNGSLYGGLRATRRWYGGQPYSDTYGAELNARRRLGSRLFGFGSLFLGQERLHDAPRDDAAEVAAATVGASLPLTSRTTFGAAAALRREFAENPWDSSWFFGVQTSLVQELPMGFKVLAQPTIAAELPDADDPLFGVRGNRTVYQAELAVSNRLVSYLGFSPSLSVQFTHQTSDLNLLDYDRARLLIGLERTF